MSMLDNSGPSIEPLGNPDRISYREPYISDILVPRLQYVGDHKRAHDLIFRIICVQIFNQ